MLALRRALISVSDKEGLPRFAGRLAELGVEIVSTGGTRRFLEEHGVPVVGVAEVTGFPEILDGRVKTLHPHIHGGILADRDRAGHLTQLKEHAIAPIDLVVVNLYPFARAIADPKTTFEQAVETIDIGGPCLLRAAAKNHRGVGVVVDPADYDEVLRHLEAAEATERRLPPELLARLALKAFRHTREYDAAIATWLAARLAGEEASPEGELMPSAMTLELRRVLEPRYGENPHQEAAVYVPVEGRLFGGMQQLQGKELSWNNLLDTDAARRMVALLAEPAVAVVKHNNPCGLGRGDDLATACERALATDPDSAFGSIIACNRPLDGAAAALLARLFVEVITAPGFSGEALEVLGGKKNLRLLSCPVYGAAPGAVELRSIDGGFLAQAPDAEAEDAAAWTCPTRRPPTAAERRALQFAWVVARHVKSNAIVLTNGDQTVGIGAGQMSRVDAARLAVDKARLPLAGTAAASDAFFPFRDGLDLLAEAGVTAVVQPGGSKRDEEVIAAADDHGMAMLFTGRRHFRH